MSHRPRSRHLAGLDGTSTRAIEILALMETGPPSRDTGWLSELTQVFNAGPEAAEQAYAVAADVVSVPVLRLMIHEFRLYTSTLRWLTGRWRHGVGEGDIAVRYASGSAGLLLAFAYVSVIETVVLAFLIPWPLVRGITLVLDLWGGVLHPRPVRVLRGPPPCHRRGRLATAALRRPARHPDPGAGHRRRPG